MARQPPEETFVVELYGPPSSSAAAAFDILCEEVPVVGASLDNPHLDASTPLTLRKEVTDPTSEAIQHRIALFDPSEENPHVMFHLGLLVDRVPIIPIIILDRHGRPAQLSHVRDLAQVQYHLHFGSLLIGRTEEEGREVERNECHLALLHAFSIATLHRVAHDEQWKDEERDEFTHRLDEAFAADLGPPWRTKPPFERPRSMAWWSERRAKPHLW